MSEHKPLNIRRVIVIVNPEAGKGRGSKTAHTVKETLERLNIKADFRSGTDASQTRAETIQAIKENPDAIVVVGGDGTLASVAPELINTNIPLCIIPAGTGNDFARALSIPHSGSDAAANAAKLLVDGSTKKVDLGEATTNSGKINFLTVIALGFDALVNERTNNLRWPKGAARYYLAIFIELLRLNPMPFRIGVDGIKPKPMPGIIAAVANTPNYGGGLPINPKASPFNGHLNLTHVAPISRLKFARLFPLLLKGTHIKRAEVTILETTSIEISAPGLGIYADGERIGDDHVSATILPAALNVITPR